MNSNATESAFGLLRRILIVRNDRIGDMALTLPAIAAARRSWPQAHLSVLASNYAGPLLAGSPLIDELIFDDASQNARQLSKRLSRMHFDAALVMNTNTRNCMAVWLAGIRCRVTWAYKPAGLFLGNCRLALHRSHPPVHEARFALAFVRRLGGTTRASDLDVRLEIDSGARSRVALRIAQELPGNGPLFGVHPLNKGSAYNWPLERYIDLVARLTATGRVMVTGAGEEAVKLKAACERLTSAERSRVAIITDLTVRELAAAVAQQTVLIASSTGPMHLAGVLGTPIVALFSPHPVHSPEKWVPLGNHHKILIPPLEAGEDPRIEPARAPEVMSRISVDEVLAEVKKQTETALDTSVPQIERAA